MKTNKILLNKKALIKATSGFLSFVLTANAGLSLLYENAYAREIDYDAPHNTLTLSSGTGEAEYFYLVKDGYYFYINDSPENTDHEEEVSEDVKIYVKANCTLVISCEYENEHGLYLEGGEETGTEAVLQVAEDGVFVHYGDVKGTGLNKIINYGEYRGETFDTSLMESDGIKEFRNEGFVEGRTVAITSNIYSEIPGTTLSVVSTFIKDDRDLDSLVRAGYNASINSTGGSFKLKVNQDTIEITEPVNGTTATSLVEDPEITLDEVPDFLVGQTINFSTYIHTADGYTGTPYIEYSYNGETWSAKAPTSAGDYYIRAVAPGVGTYRQATSSNQSVSLSYLPTSDVINDSSYCTLSGITNDVYIADELIITPPEGYTITCSHDLEAYGEDGPIFKESLSLSKDEIEVMPGFINQDVMVSFKRADGATTRDVSIYSVLPKVDEGNTVWASLIFDTEDPVITAYKNISDTNMDEVSLEETSQISADHLSIHISDFYLTSVVAEVDGVETDYSSNIMAQNLIGADGNDGISTTYFCSFDLYSTPGKAKQVTVTATDAAGRVATAEFSLYPEEPIDPELEVTLPDEIYVGDEYEPDIETNSDSEEIVFEYFDYDNDTELEEAPTAAGSYMLRVTVGLTDLFKLASFDVDFEILKHDFDVEVSVADINVGGTVSPVLSGVPADYDGTITYEYKLTTAPEEDYSTTKPTAFGAYTVRVTLSETDIYLGTEATDNFAISRNALTATVSVEDLHVGEEISAVVTTDPDDYDGDITYEYKLSTDEDDEYKEDEPTAAGTYTVRATLAATDTYLGTTATSTFTISKNDLSATVSVNNISVGETVTPVMADVPDDYDGAITYEYKLSTAEDSAYSTTVPTAAGQYSVRVILAETDIYNSFTCENTFRIIRNELHGSFFINDLYVGETISPIVNIPDDFDGNPDEFVYKYKLSSEPDSAYSETVPTAAGSYSAMVYIPQTDKYIDIELMCSFKINKKTAEATVTVPDIVIGGTISPVVTTESDGDITYEYKLSTEENYSSTVPTAAGTYDIRATIAESDTYLATSCEGSFTINKKTLTAEVSVADIKVGGTPAPVVTTDPADYNGTITYEYKLSTEDEYTLTVPSAAGEYTVRATLAETATCLGTTATSTFTISKNALTATVTVDDIYVDGTITPVVTTNPAAYNGTITYEYKLSTAENYSSTVPTAAGTYTVRATLAATDVYSGTTCTATFTISKIETTATVSVADIHVGEEIDPELTIVPEDYDGIIIYEFKGINDETYSEEVPTTAGAYTVRVTLFESEKYLGTACTDTFAISRNALTATVSVNDIYVGETPAPAVTTDPADYNGEITYEYKLSTAEDYSSTVPTAAGTYTVRANLAATDVYLSTTATSTFTISKRTARATVTAEDIHVGETVNPLVSSVSGGTYTLEYKLSTASDTEYSTTVPTAAGTYTVRATIAETASYLSTTATDTFTISKNTLTATVSVADINVGKTPNPVVTTDPADYNGTITYEYKLSTAENYSSTVPTAAGTYNVRATLAETDKYLSTTCTGTFTISKNVATSEVYVDDIVVGGIIYPDITTNSDGTATVEYKAFDADDSAYSTTLPYVEGKYTVRVTIPETAKYFATSCTSDFTISKSAVTATVYVESIYVGGEVKPVISTVSNGKEDTVFEYKTAGADDSTYTETVPSAAGTYTVRATVPATVEYIEIVCYDSFTIYLNPVAMEKFKIENYYVGQTPDPDFACTSNGDVTFEYKPKNADDSEYTTDEPTKEGIYTARATVAETSVYAAASFITDFRVSYLNAPGTAFTPEGTEGKNGYFKSDVELTAPEGYLISTSENGDYKKSIPYTEGMDTIYLKRDDGAMTSSIAITNKPKIDKVAPEFQPSTAIPQNDVLFTPGITLKIDDQNLKSLTLNGEPVDLSTITDNTLTLTPGWGVLKVDIVAEDIAGNVSRISFILKAEWLELGTIPADQLVPLDNNTEYNLAKGQWQVIKGNPEDKDFKTEADPTIYNGNMPVYVKEGGDYTVTQVK